MATTKKRATATASRKRSTAATRKKAMVVDEGVVGGFTIIEVVLVLAIAGLIFLMVFLAFPALRRSQQDTQRRQVMAHLKTAVTNYQNNNNGRLPCGSASGSVEPVEGGADMTLSALYTEYGGGGTPTGGTPTGGTPTGGTPTGGTPTGGTPTGGTPTGGTPTGGTPTGGTSSTLAFIKNYLNGADQDARSEFVDPDGYAMGLSIGKFNSGSFPPETLEFNHMAYVVCSAKCDGETPVASSNSRDFVVMYRLEGSGTYCE